MLKPRKKITRKELKKDPFLETVYKTSEHFRKYQRRYVRFGLGGLVIIILLVVVIRNQQYKGELAEAALGKALVEFDQGDIDNAVLQLEMILDDFGSTRSGNLARYFLGRYYFHSGDYATAKTYLQEFTEGTAQELVLGSAYHMLASIYAQEGDWAAARRAFDKAIKNAVSPAESQEYELAKAVFLLKRQEVAAAQEIVDRILDEVPERTPIHDQAAELAGRLLVYNSDGN